MMSQDSNRLESVVEINNTIQGITCLGILNLDKNIIP